MQTITKSLRSKLATLIFGIYCCLILIGCRLFYLQIHAMDLFFYRSQKNFLRTELIAPPRGNILDNTGKLLVTNRPVANLYWQGTGKKKFDESDLQLLTCLGGIIDKSFITDEEFLTSLQQAERHFKKILIARDIPFEQLSKIEEQFLNNENLCITTQFERFYPYKSLASHVLGYLGHINLEPIGKMGLEKLLEDLLKGEHGTILKTINSCGRNLAETETKKALAGSTITTTINLSLQQIIEATFPAQQAGTVILMNPQDGALLGLVSRPDFDPSMFLQQISHEEWQNLQDKRCFLNRAFNACYPPGSIFKLVTISAALERNIISPHAHMQCNGHTTYCGRQYRCARLEGHGYLSTCQAVAHSCNILFYEIGKHIDIDILTSYAHKFGLGEKTNILFAEKVGLVPSRQWKLKTRNERWWQGETLSVAIGQSFLLVTPIQVARMIAGIFTGFLPTPRILTSEETAVTPLDINPETLAFLRKTMHLAITDGTGQRVNHIKNFEIYGKTSTAQTSQLEKRDFGLQYVEHGWFVAYFKYKNHKPLVLVILLENIGSSRAATAIAKNFFMEYKRIAELGELQALSI